MHGDEAAFDALIERVGDHLHSVARRILRDPYLAEDAMQRALLDAWRFLPRSETRTGSRRGPTGSSSTPATPKRAASDTTAATSGCWQADHPGDPDPAANVSLSHQLDQAFGALGVEHRTVVVLVHYVGLTPAEAATAMGTPIGTVRSRLHYALKHLRAALEADARLERTAGTA